MTGRINVTLGNDASVILVTFLHYVLVTLQRVRPPCCSA